jgi:hypothetical protein
MRAYLAPKLLITTSSGVADRLAATAFFSLASARSERGSIVLTSNKGFGERGEILGSGNLNTAPLACPIETVDYGEYSEVTQWVRTTQ